MTRWLVVSIVLTLISLAATVTIYFGMYDRLADQVPIHWNIHGEPDGWVAKDNAWSIFLLGPGVMALLVVLTVVLPWMSPRHFDVDRFRDVYAYIMMLVVALMGFIHLVILWGSFQESVPLIRVLVAGIFLFFALLGNVLGQVRRNFWMGVRTPWTLASEPVWIQTHRLSAWLFLGAGLAGCGAVLAGAPLAACFVGLMIVVFIPVIYSFVLYKRLEHEGKV